jgi:hypothetical protein
MTSTTDRYKRGRTAIRATRLFDGTGTATAADPLIVVSDGAGSSRRRTRRSRRIWAWLAMMAASLASVLPSPR